MTVAVKLASITSNMKALVTGGAGFIGSHIQDKLIELGYEVAVLDNLKSGKKENLNSKSAFFEVDITDKSAVEKVFEDFKPEIVFHLAAQNEVPYSMTHPIEDAQINIIGTLNLLEASKTHGVKKFIYTDTGGAFYGEVDENDLPISENHPINKPSSFYGVSKMSAEIYVRLYGNLYQIPWVSLRYSNVYGPRQEGNKEAGVVAIFTQKMLNHQTPTINGDGLHTRDYVYVSDVVDANIKSLNLKESDYFNISTQTRISNNQVFEAIEQELKTGLTPLHGPDRPGDVRHISLSNKKAQTLLNWTPQTGFASGIKKTIEYYKK